MAPLAVLALLAAAASVQEPQPASTKERPVVRVSVDLIQVDAVVTDGNGRHVDDLPCDQFEIFEDGKPQPVANCSYVRTNGSSPAASPALGSQAAGSATRQSDVQRTLVLMVDDLRLDQPGVAATRDALTRFVDEQMQPGDLAAIVRTGSGTGLLQQFTNDKRLLRSAIAKIRFNLASLELPEETTGAGGAHPGEHDFQRLHDASLAGGTVGTLRFVLQQLRALPGRKSLMFFSNGYGIRESDDPSVETAFGQAVPEIVELANRASTVVYAVDGRGVSVDAGAGRLLGELSGLYAISEPTGGLVLGGNNDFTLQISRALADQNGYYLIGYAPSEATFERAPDGRARRHVVRIRVKSKDLQVRTRAAFYGVVDAESSVDAGVSTDLVSRLLSPFGADEIGLSLDPHVTPDQTGGVRLLVSLWIDAEHATVTQLADGRPAARLEVLVLTFDAEGKLVDRLDGSGGLPLGANAPEGTSGKGIPYEVEVPVKKAGGYQVRVAVRDTASGRVGSGYAFVEIPPASHH